MTEDETMEVSDETRPRVKPLVPPMSNCGRGGVVAMVDAAIAESMVVVSRSRRRRAAAIAVSKV